MTIEEIRAEIEKLNAKVEQIEEEKEILYLKLQHLQKKCPHKNGYSYNDRSGVSCYTCPDCGYDS